MSDQANVWRLDLANEDQTRDFAQTVASFVGAGDLVTLSGDLGAGKTAFARALIRSLTEDAALEVPSPTFTLMQVYETEKYPIVHADLYRIGSPDELADLGWDEATDSALVLVEWAERAGELMPPDRLDIRLTIPPGHDEARIAEVTGHGGFGPRLMRARGATEVLRRSGWSGANRTFMLGDASTRAYERLEKPDGERAILMISPPRPDGPPVRFGKPYSAIARLAEDIRPFVAIDNALRSKGLSAPEIYAADLDSGFAVLEDLGAEGVVDGNGPIRERYAVALDVLAYLHGMELSDVAPLTLDRNYTIPPYDLDALLIEVELLTEWYAPFAGANLSSGARATFVNLWRQTVIGVVAAAPTWTLRDYHSPNLIWLDDREGYQRIGIIDFQDCVMGHPAYDVASLLQDARVTVPDDVEIRLLGHYAQARRAATPDFDMAAFARAYAILGAQRATKILGIFARLDKRDGKPQYLAHLPRVSRYLRKNLTHPAMSQLRDWYVANLPRLFEDA
ncbi:MAG: tRNA (adenosine(37)-N6)-threonylcarbamoyltransferase complex ATPase subunit type 1 TsaE [Beijerinckiaceae bacterium]